MKRTISATLMAAILSNLILPSWAIAQGAGDNGIANPHQVKVRDKRTEQLVTGIGGMKYDPREGKVLPYRTFNDPRNGDIIEQWLIGKERSGEEILHEVRSERSATRSEVVSKTIEQNNLRETPTQKLSDDSKNQRYLIIGAAVVGVVSLGFIGRAIYRGGKKSQVRLQQREAEVYEAGKTAGRMERPSAVADMPKQVKLGPDVPGGAAGKTVNVAGAVPSSSVPANVPRFTTATGDTYIIQQNPNTNLFETIFLYDMLTRPYYYPGAYMYPSYAYSPFFYGAGETIVIHEQASSAISSPDAWASEPYVERVTTAETTTVESHTVSDAVEPASQSDFGSTSSSDPAPAVESDSGSSGGSLFGGGGDTTSSSDFGGGSSSGWDSGSSGGGFDSGSSFGGGDSGGSSW